MELLDRFSATVAELHRGDLAQPLERFHDWAFETVKPLVPFDTGFWGAGAAPTEKAAVVHNLHLHGGLPQCMTYDWEAVKDTPADREFVRTVAEAGGKSVLLDSNALKHHPLYPKYGILHILTAYLPEPTTGLFNVVSFYRSATYAPFTETERRLHQALVPHLLDMERKVRLRQFDNECARRETVQLGRQATCDAEGILRLAQPGFVRALHTEWPDWCGPTLPEPIAARVAKRQVKDLVGAHVVVSISRHHDMFRLTARNLGPIDTLSGREKEVAHYWRNGASYKVIAARMGIAPNTVRNHLYRVYEKLGVSSRYHLATLLDPSGFK